MRARHQTVGLLLGGAAWALVAMLLPHVPIWLRFFVALSVFTIGTASLVLGLVVARLPGVEQTIVLAAFGVGVAPLLGELLARVGVIQAFPYLAASGLGLLVVRRPFAGKAPRQRFTAVAVLVPVAIALITGALVFGHRLTMNDAGVTVFGDYDSVDLSYYAGITGELTHRVPPMAPFYAGHPLNYSWYPQLLLALVHRFAAVRQLSS